MSTMAETRFDPSEISKEELKTLFQLIDGGARPVLIGKDGKPIELPKRLNDLFVHILETMKRRQAVFIMHEDEAFTTQAAANFLGVSRQYLVRLLEDGKLPFHRVGTHRRVLFKDLVVYRNNRSRIRRSKLDQMTTELVEAGLYDRFIPLEDAEEE